MVWILHLREKIIEHNHNNDNIENIINLLGQTNVDNFKIVYKQFKDFDFNSNSNCVN